MWDIEVSPMRKLTVLVVVLLLTGAVVFGVRTPRKTHEIGGFSLNETALRSFLESQYVPEVGLLRAAVKAYPDNETVYVANDNLLASRALLLLGSPLGERIEENLDENYSGGWSGKVDVLLGRPISGFFCSETEVLGKCYSSSYNGRYDIRNII